MRRIKAAGVVVMLLLTAGVIQAGADDLCSGCTYEFDHQLLDVDCDECGGLIDQDELTIEVWVSEKCYIGGDPNNVKWYFCYATTRTECDDHASCD